MAVLGLPNEVADLVAAGRGHYLEQVPGIGKSLAETITRYLTTRSPAGGIKV
jgi:Holliday junction resolvasome RuvABC DNA-binding subunit